MKVVLRNTVDGVGKRGDIVEVSDGYGRNYLIPQGLAMRATTGVEREAEAMRRAEGVRDAKSLASAQEIAARIGSTPLTIAARASDEGKLFGSVGAADIVGAFGQLGIEVERRWVELDDPIKELGMASVTVRPHTDVAAAVSVTVIADEG